MFETHDFTFENYTVTPLHMLQIHASELTCGLSHNFTY